jgi:hypothetical protein
MWVTTNLDFVDYANPKCKSGDLRIGFEELGTGEIRDLGNLQHN